MCIKASNTPKRQTKCNFCVVHLTFRCRKISRSRKHRRTKWQTKGIAFPFHLPLSCTLKASVPAVPELLLAWNRQSRPLPCSPPNLSNLSNPRHECLRYPKSSIVIQFLSLQSLVLRSPHTDDTLALLLRGRLWPPPRPPSRKLLVSKQMLLRRGQQHPIHTR